LTASRWPTEWFPNLVSMLQIRVRFAECRGVKVLNAVSDRSDYAVKLKTLGPGNGTVLVQNLEQAVENQPHPHGGHEKADNADHAERNFENLEH